MINSNAFSNFWYMMFVCSLSTQDNAIIISSKNICCWEIFFSYIIVKVFIASFATKSAKLSSWKIGALGDLLVDGILGRYAL